MKKPNYKTFAEVAAECRGNITKIAKVFGVFRSTVYMWANKDIRFKEVIDNYKGELLDECVSIGRVVALGIPEKNEKGEFAGWKERPDSSMIRYFLSTLGHQEGYGEGPQSDNNNSLQDFEPPQIIFEK